MIDVLEWFVCRIMVILRFRWAAICYAFLVFLWYGLYSNKLVFLWCVPLPRTCKQRWTSDQRSLVWVGNIEERLLHPRESSNVFHSLAFFSLSKSHFAKSLRFIISLREKCIKTSEKHADIEIFYCLGDMVDFRWWSTIGREDTSGTSAETEFGERKPNVTKERPASVRLDKGITSDAGTSSVVQHPSSERKIECSHLSTDKTFIGRQETELVWPKGARNPRLESWCGPLSEFKFPLCIAIHKKADCLRKFLKSANFIH